jgi:uncharacterized membrane protein YfcA
MTLELALLVILVFTISTVLKGWSGFGTNLIAIPALAIYLGYDYIEAVVIVLTLNFFINIAMLIENKKFNVKSLENIKVLILFGLIFHIVGLILLKGLDTDILKIVAGSLIILTVINKAFDFKFTIKNKEKYYIPVGILSGLFNGMAGLGGLPVLLLLSNSDMEKEDFKSTLVSYFFVMSTISIISFVIGGFYTSFILLNIAIVVIFAISGAMFGVYLSRRVSDKGFQTGMLFILFFMGASMIYDALDLGEIISNIF